MPLARVIAKWRLNMASLSSKPTLSAIEKSVIKALIIDGWRNQDILSLINTGRQSSVNFGRIAAIKNNHSITAASKDQLDLFKQKKIVL